MTFKGNPNARDPRNVAAPKGSTNAELLALPQQRRATHDMNGRLLLFPRTGIVGVAHEDQRNGHYYVTVVNGENCTKEGGTVPYPRGGHGIVVSGLEMQTAIELEVRMEWYCEVRIQNSVLFPDPDDPDGWIAMWAPSREAAEEIAATNSQHDTRVVQKIETSAIWEPMKEKN